VENCGNGGLEENYIYIYIYVYSCWSGHERRRRRQKREREEEKKNDGNKINNKNARGIMRRNGRKRLRTRRRWK
jgi:hypothetical protein